MWFKKAKRIAQLKKELDAKASEIVVLTDKYDAVIKEYDELAARHMRVRDAITMRTSSRGRCYAVLVFDGRALWRTSPGSPETTQRNIKALTTGVVDNGNGAPDV